MDPTAWVLTIMILSLGCKRIKISSYFMIPSCYNHVRKKGMIVEKFY